MHNRTHEHECEDFALIKKKKLENINGHTLKKISMKYGNHNKYNVSTTSAISGDLVLGTFHILLHGEH